MPAIASMARSIKGMVGVGRFASKLAPTKSPYLRLGLWL